MGRSYECVDGWAIECIFMRTRLNVIVMEWYEFTK
jgi:hypothetical protein